MQGRDCSGGVADVPEKLHMWGRDAHRAIYFGLNA